MPIYNNEQPLYDYKPTGIIDKLVLRNNNPLDAWLGDTKLTAKDMGDYYAYSDGSHQWTYPKNKLEDTSNLNAQQRLERDWRKSSAYGFDKVMLGTLGLGAAPFFAMEATPTLVGLANAASDAAMATRAGQAVYQGLTSPVGKAALSSVFGGMGMHNFFSDNGYAKTLQEWNNLKNDPNFYNAVNFGKSALGDAMDVTMMAPLYKPLTYMGREVYGNATNVANNASNIYKNYKIAQALNKGIKENGIITAYNRNPAITDTGNLWNYQSYLDQVFPNTKVKDILWHGSRSKNLEFFDTGLIGTNMPIKNSVGMYLSPNKYVGESYGSRGGAVYPILLNTENPLVHHQIWGLPKNGINVAKISPEVKNTLLKDYDAVIAPERGEIAFFNPDNALVLGSNKDLQGFRTFMSENATSPQNIISKESLITQEPPTISWEEATAPKITEENAASMSPEKGYFIDDFGKETVLTPYLGTDEALANSIEDAQLASLRYEFSAEKKEKLKEIMGWTDAEINEYRDELLRSIGTVADTEVSGVDAGFKEIASHQGHLVGSGNDMIARHKIILNRDRIPDDNAAIEAGIHEIGGHGRTVSIEPSEVGIEGSYSNIAASGFPRIAEIMQKNAEIAKNTLVLNEEGKIFDSLDNIADVEKWLYSNNIPVKDRQDFISKWKHYKYSTSNQELVARGYTGQVFNKLYGNEKTDNIKQLERYYTPESVESYKNAVLSSMPWLVGAGTAGALYETTQEDNTRAYGGPLSNTPLQESLQPLNEGILMEEIPSEELQQSNAYKQWNDLSLKEKAEMMKVAIRNGITNLSDIRDKYNEFAMGGDTIYNGGALPEVVVTPTDSASWLFSDGKYKYNSRKPLGDKYTRKIVSEYLSQFDNKSAKEYNAIVSRLTDVLDIRGAQFLKNNVKSGKLKGRAHYDANSDTAYVDSMNDIFEEVGHPWQYAKGNNNREEEFIEKNYDPDSDPRGGTRYAYPDTSEGETHTFFTPTLKEWVETGNIGKSSPIVNRKLSEQKIIPKDRMEVVDSAASWDKQAIERRILANPRQLPLHKRIQYSIFDFPLLENKKAFGGNIYSSTKSGNIYDGTKMRTQQMNQQANPKNIYDVLPLLFAKDGVKIKVTSGYRPNAQVLEGGKNTGRRSRHSIWGGAADIVAIDGSNFADIRRVLDDPNSNTSRWLRANGYGYLDETSATGTTKYWHDHNRDHSHYHIGKDYGNKYASMLGSTPIQVKQNGNNYIDIAKDHIRRNESFFAKSYADAPTGKNWRSVGYGFNDSGFWGKYPNGISKYYDARGGITKEEAERELDWMLRTQMIPTLEKTYGSRWNQFNDNQKAAIIDTMYQRPASVLRDSAFYNAIMSNSPNAVDYLGVKSYDRRNADRRNLYTMDNMEVPNNVYYPEQQMAYNPFIGYQVSNPKAFYGNPEDYQQDYAKLFSQQEVPQPLVDAAFKYSEEEQRKAERQQQMANFRTLLGMTGAFDDDGLLGGVPLLTGRLFGNTSAYGGRLYGDGGEKEKYVIQDSIVPDALFVQRPVYDNAVFVPNVSREDTLKRANHVYKNYSEAKDSPLSKGQEDAYNALRYLKDNVSSIIPAGVSNCTLTATQWINPRNPIKNASSIVNNPSMYGYEPILQEDAIPGDLLIAKTPNKDSYHTMLITGFADNDGEYFLDGNNFGYKKGEPLLTYSRGGHDASFIRTGVPLSVYNANSDGHTESLYYRYKYPNESFLPLVTVNGR